jgi:hypothetical protein
LTGPDWVQIIGAVFTGLVLLLNTWATLQTRKDVTDMQENATDTARSQGEKLDVIHESTNGGMAALEKKLAASDARVARLEEALIKSEQDMAAAARAPSKGRADQPWDLPREGGVIIMADETKKEADARRLQELLQRRDSGGFLTSEEIAELDALEEAARKAAEKAAEKAARV